MIGRVVLGCGRCGRLAGGHMWQVQQPHADAVQLLLRSRALHVHRQEDHHMSSTPMYCAADNTDMHQEHHRLCLSVHLALVPRSAFEAWMRLPGVPVMSVYSTLNVQDT